MKSQPDRRRVRVWEATKYSYNDIIFRFLTDTRPRMLALCLILLCEQYKQLNYIKYEIFYDSSLSLRDTTVQSHSELQSQFNY